MNPIFIPGNLLLSTFILVLVAFVVCLIMPERKKPYLVFLSNAAMGYSGNSNMPSKVPQDDPQN